MLSRRCLLVAIFLGVCSLGLARIASVVGQDAPAASAKASPPAVQATPANVPTAKNAAVSTSPASPAAGQGRPVAGLATQNAATSTSLDKDKGCVTVQLVRVRFDWSKGKDPEATKKVLEKLLEGAALPDEFRKNLLGYASRILFPEGFVAGYHPEQLADLLAWMKERDLVRIDTQSEPLADAGAKAADIHQCKLFVSGDVLPVDVKPSAESVPPFVRRTFGWEWDFASCVRPDDSAGLPNMELNLVRYGLRIDEMQVNGEKTVTAEALSGEVTGVRFPAHLVGVIRCFIPKDAMYDRTLAEGWDPLLIVRPVTLGEPAASVQRQLSKPSVLVKMGRWRPEWASGALPRVPFGFSGKAAAKSGGASKQVTSPPISIDGQQIKIFRLVYADARQAGEIVAQLFPNIAVQPDPRTNSLIVRGAEDQLQIVEAILLRLDETPSKPQSPASEEASRHDNLDTTRNDFTSKEAEARSLAQSIAAEKDSTKVKQLRVRLEGLVGEAFDLRQKLQRAELGLLQERIRIIETRLQQREVLRKEIIGRRVEELLAGKTTGTIDTPVSGSGPRKESAHGTVPTLTGTLPSLPLRTPEEFQKAAYAAQELVRNTQERLEIAKRQGPQKYVSQLTEELPEAERRLALIQAEYAAQVRLLKLDVQSKETSLAAAKEELDRDNALAKANAISTSELSEAKLKHDQAVLQLEQVKTLLELYMKAGENSDLNPKSK